MPVVTTLCTSLPPYSPDYNPIELAFSKIKAYVRRDGTLGREPLDEAV
jgi:transposase